MSEPIKLLTTEEVNAFHASGGRRVPPRLARLNTAVLRLQADEHRAYAERLRRAAAQDDAHATLATPATTPAAAHAQRQARDTIARHEDAQEACERAQRALSMVDAEPELITLEGGPEQMANQLDRRADALRDLAAKLEHARTSTLARSTR